MAAVADHALAQADFLLSAFDHFFKSDFDIHLYILAARFPPGRPAAAENVGKNIFKTAAAQIKIKTLSAAKTLEAEKIKTAGALARPALKSLAELVVLLALGFVRQDLVGLVDLLEFGLIPARLVRVMFVRQFPVGFLDLIVGCALGNA